MRKLLKRFRSANWSARTTTQPEHIGDSVIKKIDVRGSFPASKRPYEISAIRINPVNRDEIAAWIKREIGHYPYFDDGVLNVGNDPEYPSVYLIGYIGDYLVLENGKLSVYSHTKFWEKYFTP